MAKAQRKPKTLREKIETEFPEFADEVVTLNVTQLETRIAKLQKDLEDSEQHKAQNEPLSNAKKEVKLLSGGYSDVKKGIGLQTRYMISLIREKGGQ